MSENVNNKKALKAGVWYTVSSISVKAITIVTTAIFTRLMSTSDYGLATTFTSWYTLLLIFCSLNLTYSIGRAKIDYPGKLENYVGSMQLLSLIATGIACLISLLFVDSIAKGMELNRNLVYILMIYLLFQPAISFSQSKFRYQYRYKGNIGITAYITIGSVVVSLLLIPVFQTEMYYAKVLGSVIPAVLLSIIFWAQAIKKKEVGVNVEYWKYGLSISLPLILHSVSLNILSQSDRIMITKFCGTDYTGIYSLAYSYAILINIILHSVNEAWLPWFHDTYHAEKYEDIKKNVKPFIILGSMLGIGCLAIAPEAMMILGPEEYSAGMWCVAPVTIGVLCQFMYQQYVHIELHLKKTQYISMGTVIAAAMNLVLNVIFIPKFGFIAAAYTTLFCYFILMFVHLFITRVVLKVHLYDDFFMFLVLAVVVGISIVFMLLYSKILIRYILLTLVCLLYLYTNRTFIINFVKKKKRVNGVK